jgi:hypothetical protein
MADTGNPWFIPFAEPSDLVRDWPALSSAVGTAVAAGLSAASVVVDVKSVLKTNVFSASVASGAHVEVTDMTITHTLASASNKLLLMANVTVASSDSANQRTAPIFYDGTDLLGRGDADGVRSRTAGFTSAAVASAIPIMLLHSPGVATPLTYSIRVLNADNTTRTLYVNRVDNDTNDIRIPRSSSTFVLIEVAA